MKIDTNELIERCIKDSQNWPTVPKMRLVFQTADINIANYGVKKNNLKYARSEEKKQALTKDIEMRLWKNS